MPLNTKRQKDKELTKRPGDQKTAFGGRGCSMSLTTMRPKYIKSYPKDQKTKRHKELTNQETRRPKYIIWCGGGDVV